MDEYDEVRVLVEDLPYSVRGVCYHDDDGNDYIILNSRMPREIQRRTYAHEMRHILHGDMYNPHFCEY